MGATTGMTALKLVEGELYAVRSNSKKGCPEAA